MKRILALVITFVFALSLIGCGAKSADSGAYYNVAKEAPMMMAETAATADYAGGAMYEEAYEEGGYDGEVTASAGTSAVNNPSRKLIKNVYLSLQTKELAKTTKAIETKVAALGGYIESTTVSNPDNYGDYRNGGTAYYTCRIPSNKLDQFVKEVEGVGNVTYKTENVTDITLTYADTESRKSSLKTEQKRLEELMDKADSVEDLITIEQRMSEVRYQLESIESQLRTYDNQVDYSTVSLDISEVVEYTAPKKGTFAERVRDGLTENLSDLANFLEEAAIWFITSLPTLIVLAIVVVIIIFIIKAIRKGSPKREAKRAQKAAAKAAKKAEKLAAKAAKKAERLAAKNAAAAPEETSAGTEDTANQQ